MIRQAVIMVLWSYILLSVPGFGSIENVLAPVDEAGLEPDDDTGTGESSYSAADNAPDLPAAARPVDGIDLLAELERMLADRLQPAGTLRLIPVAQLPRLPKGMVLPEVILLDHPTRLTSSNALLRFRLLDEGRIIGDHAVSFRVQVLADVWTPNRRIAPGEALHAEDLSIREVDLVREPKAVPADRSLLGRYEIFRAVVPDRVLSWSDIAPRALVRKGDVVDVIANGGLLSISMKGQATRSGALGELVTVRNIESKREFSAEVIDENRVRVHF